MHKSIALSALCALFGFTVACGGNEPAPVTPTEPTPSTPATDAPADLPAADAGAPTAAPTPADPALTDEQIAKVSWTLHDGEIVAGKLAATNAKNAKVKKFAAMMVKHHSDAQKKEEALATKAKIMPGDSPASSQLAQENESVAATLKGLKGAEFDKAYMDSQVKGHEKALETVEQKLVPAAQNAELKAALTAFKPTIESHLKEAREIQSGLN